MTPNPRFPAYQNTTLIFISLLTLTACRGPKASAPNPDSSPSVRNTIKEMEKKGNRRVLETGGEVTLQVARPDGTLAWDLTAATSRLAIEEEGRKQGFFTNVSGTLMDEGKPVSEYQAAEAKADTQARTLKLFNKVSISSLTYKATLTAQDTEWLEDRKLISASGSVYVKTDLWTYGPFSTLLATPDLTKIGSPDQFK